MILFGGYDNTFFDENGANLTQDPWAGQLAVFDMNNLQWKNKYEATADSYTLPAIIKSNNQLYVFTCIYYYNR